MKKNYYLKYQHTTSTSTSLCKIEVHIVSSLLLLSCGFACSDRVLGYCQSISFLCVEVKTISMLSATVKSMAGIQIKDDLWEFVDCTTTSNTDVGSASLKNKKKREQKKKKLEMSRKALHHGKVTFGTVEEILFSREISYDAIPSRGAYPLGLGDLESRGNIRNIDDYCAEQQINLRLRSASFENHSSSSSCIAESSLARVCSNDADVETLESRQYDYRLGKRNLLFEPTSEEERLVILGSYISASGMRKSQLHPEGDSSGSASAGLHSHPIADLNRDVKNIRATRDSTGCTCKALKADKLSVIKMKTELSAHGHLVGIVGKDAIEKLSKSELIGNVKEMLKLCVLCTENNCECVQLGVPCSAEVSPINGIIEIADCI